MSEAALVELAEVAILRVVGHEGILRADFVNLCIVEMGGKVVLADVAPRRVPLPALAEGGGHVDADGLIGNLLSVVGDVEREVAGCEQGDVGTDDGDTVAIVGVGGCQRRHGPGYVGNGLDAQQAQVEVGARGLRDEVDTFAQAHAHLIRADDLEAREALADDDLERAGAGERLVAGASAGEVGQRVGISQRDGDGALAHLPGFSIEGIVRAAGLNRIYVDYRGIRTGDAKVIDVSACRREGDVALHLVRDVDGLTEELHVEVLSCGGGLLGVVNHADGDGARGLRIVVGDNVQIGHAFLQCAQGGAAIGELYDARLGGSAAGIVGEQTVGDGGILSTGGGEGVEAGELGGVQHVTGHQLNAARVSSNALHALAHDDGHGGDRRLPRGQPCGGIYVQKVRILQGDGQRGFAGPHHSGAARDAHGTSQWTERCLHDVLIARCNADAQNLRVAVGGDGEESGLGGHVAVEHVGEVNIRAPIGEELLAAVEGHLLGIVVHADGDFSIDVWVLSRGHYEGACAGS